MLDNDFFLGRMWDNDINNNFFLISQNELMNYINKITIISSAYGMPKRLLKIQVVQIVTREQC